MLRIYVLGPSGIGKTYSINRLTKSLGLLKKWNQYNFKDSRIIDKDLESIYQLILQNAPFNLSKLRRQSIRLNQKVYNEVFARDYKGVIIIDEGLISGITPDLIKKGEVDEALKSYIKDSVFVFLSSDKSHIINNRNLRNKTSKNSGKFYSVDSHVLDDEIEKYNTLQTKIELMGVLRTLFIY